MNWRGLLNVSQNSAKIYHQYLWGIRINYTLGKFLYNFFKDNFQDSNPNILKEMSSPRPVSRVTCSGKFSAEWWGEFRQTRAVPPAEEGQRQPLSVFRNKQLIKSVWINIVSQWEGYWALMPTGLKDSFCLWWTYCIMGWWSAEAEGASSTSQMSRAGYTNCTCFSLCSWRS